MGCFSGPVREGRSVACSRRLRFTALLHLRPPEWLGTSRPAGEEQHGTIADGSGMVNEGPERRTALTRGGTA